MNSYGSVTHAGGRWIIRCEPHIRARLKRVFPRAPVTAAEKIILTDTPENSRELEWFLQRYPMEIVAPEAAQRLQAQAADHRDTETRLADLLAARCPPLQIELAEPPRQYQVFAAQMLQIKRGLLLGDDLGIGKTVSAICAMVLPENLPAVVVCPAHLPRHWERAINRFAPALKVHRVREGKPYPLIRQPRGRQKDLFSDRLPDVIIVSYHKLRTWAPVLCEIARLVVYEECQQLRNPGSAIYEACKTMAGRAQLRLGLSATPIFNYGSEFYWVVDCLLPDALGSREEFVREWCGAQGGDKARIADAVEFGGYLRREGIMLRRTRAEVGRELPSLTKIPHTIDADTGVLEKAEGDAMRLAKIILAHNETFKGQKMLAAGEFDALMRQATGVAKAPFVAEYVRLLCESGEKVVLFGWHREVYSIWQEKLKDLQPVLYTGSESEAQKDAAAQRFINDDDCRLMIISLRSGAGLDGLQKVCRTAVFGELDWSPGVHEQCMGRVHRDGQADPVMAYFLISDQGSDPIVANVLGVKREQIEGVRNPDAGLIERLEISEHHLQRLARDFLERRGEAAPESTTVTALGEPV